LKREAPLVLRYLLLAHSGNAGRPQIEAVAERFAARPGFEVKKSKRPHRRFDVQRKQVNPQPNQNDESR
jgi:hypothetical protein